ncbi:MAG: transaldolase [Campylobacterales bacterium]|nr:transaldolase [Campylobacterales bacterium]
MGIKGYEDINFSLWCDFVERDFLKNDFLKLIESKIINGATSNPAIFKDAILKSTAYKEQIESLEGKNSKEIYESLAILDIQTSANALHELYKSNNDGFISIEVDPNLCHDTKATVEEGLRLHEMIAKENVMIKVPATNAGYEAITELTKRGISVNATLIFSPNQTLRCVESFDKGIKNDKTKGVISIFVSRFDRKLDSKLPQNLKGKTGIYNASKCYNEIMNSNVKNIKPLFASTGVKGDDFKSTYYIEELLYPNAINTAPLNTINEFAKLSNVPSREALSSEVIEEFFNNISNCGIDMNVVYDELLHEGLIAFVDSFKELLGSF